MLLLDILLVLTTLVFYNALAATSFDREFAEVRGLPVRFLHFLLPAMIALSVVMIIQVTGLILVIALLTAPAYMAGRRARSLWAMMAMSALYSAIFCVSGLFLSYYLDLTSGASIIAVAAACFFLSMAYDAVRSGFEGAGGRAGEVGK
jgi:zinc transport system permease protein